MSDSAIYHYLRRSPAKTTNLDTYIDKYIAVRIRGLHLWMVCCFPCVYTVGLARSVPQIALPRAGRRTFPSTSRFARLEVH